MTTIGGAARMAGVHVETIRYYERRGLIDRPEKPAHGFRAYSADTIARVRAIKRAQALGFTLQEVKTLLGLPEQDCGEAMRIALEKIAQVEAKIADLQRIKRALASVTQQCANNKTASCPILAAVREAND